MRLLLTAVALLASLAAHADSWVARYAQLRPEVKQACDRHDLLACHAGLLELARLLDDRQDVVYKLARVEAELGLSGLALRRLEIYARSGLDLGDPSTEPAFAVLKKAAAFERSVALYQAGKAAVVEHERIVSLGDSDLVAEDIVCDGGNSFLVSSVRQRKALQVSASGSISDFTQRNVRLWGVFALGLDPQRAILWETTSTSAVSPPYAPPETDRSAVLAIDRRSGAMRARYELPGGTRHAFGDMTVAPDGSVYVSDGLGGGVFTVRATDTTRRLETLVEPGVLGSPQTPALTRDGSTLLVPDYQRGIARVALRERSVSWLQRPPELALFGIDGMYLEGRTLVAIQNGTVPERIVMMHLSRTFDRVDSWRVLLARAPGLGDPTHGCLRHGEFYFIANSGWDQFDDDGSRVAGVVPAPPEIWRIRIPATP